jgi:hypothetical protein
MLVAPNASERGYILASNLLRHCSEGVTDGLVHLLPEVFPCEGGKLNDMPPLQDMSYRSTFCARPGRSQ